MQWCKSTAFPAATASSKKLVSFLSDQVVDRTSRKHTGINICILKERMAVADNKIGIKTVQSYVSAIADLYQEEVHLVENSNSHPGDRAVKELLQAITRENHCPNRRNFYDQGMGTIQDG